jgi:hypothetical protein|tara:strand:- start:283 stop:501 length:219 start_codon:yes stop_codon:yes gene_type:complete
MKVKELENGSLYYNIKSDRVERVRAAANSQSVFITHHDFTPLIVPAKDLRLADGEEVSSYLGDKARVLDERA